MSQFIYINQEFMNMTEDERDKAIICSGPIDFSRLYRQMKGVNFGPTQQERQQTQSAFEKVRRELTRCQIDLIKAEFGTQKVALGAAVPYTDTLCEAPMSANVEKLRDALSMIKSAM